MERSSRRNSILLRYWYRQGDAPMVPTEFHSDLLIPGVITETDPSPIISGMVGIKLDARGSLVRFEATPPQLLSPWHRSRASGLGSLLQSCEPRCHQASTRRAILDMARELG